VRNLKSALAEAINKNNLLCDKTIAMHDDFFNLKESTVQVINNKAVIDRLKKQIIRMNFGIEAIEAYFPLTFIEQTDLCIDLSI
jgi:hypothetical protein